MAGSSGRVGPGTSSRRGRSDDEILGLQDGSRSYSAGKEVVRGNGRKDSGGKRDDDGSDTDEVGTDREENGGRGDGDRSPSAMDARRGNRSKKGSRGGRDNGRRSEDDVGQDRRGRGQNVGMNTQSTAKESAARKDLQDDPSIDSRLLRTEGIGETRVQRGADGENNTGQMRLKGTVSVGPGQSLHNVSSVSGGSSDSSKEQHESMLIGNLIPTVFKATKFFGSAEDIGHDSKIAKFFCKKLCIEDPEAKRMWWDRRHNDVRKKLDAKRSSVTNAIKHEYMMLRSEKNLPDELDMFFRLSKDKDTMKLFLDSFVSCVVGRMDWRKETRQKIVSNVATPTDEAFALLVLENIWDAWKHVDPQEYIMARSKRRKEDDDDDVEGASETNNADGTMKKGKRRKEIPGRYTKEHRNAKRFRGWGEDGHARFNQLVKLVRNDRKVRGSFEEEYLEKKKKKLKGNSSVELAVGDQEVLELEDDWDDIMKEVV